jgi:hypothetical protein
MRRPAHEQPTAPRYFQPERRYGACLPGRDKFPRPFETAVRRQGVALRPIQLPPRHRDFASDRALVGRALVATLFEPIEHLADQFGLGNSLLTNAPRNRCIERIPFVTGRCAGPAGCRFFWWSPSKPSLVPRPVSVRLLSLVNCTSTPAGGRGMSASRGKSKPSRPVRFVPGGDIRPVVRRA